MEIIENILSITSKIATFKMDGKSVGFVPTMGALHDGHLSLIEISKRENNFTVVSIFVNPTQFNDKNDLINYPRTLEEDLEKLRKFNCDIVFAPSEQEMYPEADNRIFDFGNLDKVMEGKSRQGHFNGVALIVSKLFDIVKPDKAYFGEKDFQQLAIIKALVKELNLPIKIIPCPIIREPDGLALSSRNRRLSKEERENATIISQTLFKAKELSKTLTVEEVKNWVAGQINKNPYLELDYFEIVDDVELRQIEHWGEQKNKVGCIAVKVGEIRLIDNIKFYL